MASFNCFNTGCPVKSEVKTELTPVVIEPLLPTTPQQTRPTPARIYRPWEDSPSTPPPSPPSPQSNFSPSLSSSPSTHGSLPSTHSSSSSAHSSSPSAHSSSPSTHSSSPSTHSSNEVVCQHASFLRAVSRLQTRVHPTDTWLATLVSCYLREVFRLETYRSHALVAALPPTPAVHAAVHQHYDSERLALLQQANSSLVGYSCTLASRVSSLQQQQRAYQQQTPPTTPLQGGHLDRSYSSGSGASSPDSTPSPRLSHSRIAIDDTPSRTASSCSSSNKRLLGQSAIRVLDAWYSRHQHYPYADAAQVRHLAAEGGISSVQVRKWLANRRLRGHNTTGYVGKSLKTRRALSSYSSQ